MKLPFRATVFAAAMFMATQAFADITVGVILPLTGPASALGIPTKNGISMWPETIAGQKLKIIIVDDASDSTVASKAARRLTTEANVDLIVGSTATPPAIAISDVAAETQTVQLATSPIDVPEGKAAWTFRLPQSNAVMAGGVVERMKKLGVKTIGFLGYGDAYGESWLKELSAQASKAGMQLVATERFARADTSVTAQALKIASAKPDAVLIVASGSGAAMPHKTMIERGYKGQIFQTHSAASRDLMRIGGKDVEGAHVIAGLAVLPEALPANHPAKKLAVDFVERYEKQFGAGTRNQFSAHGYDASLVLAQVLPEVLKKAKPGTPEFRKALKDALENAGDIPLTQGTMHWTAKDHFGLGDGSRMMLTVKDGNWKVD